MKKALVIGLLFVLLAPIVLAEPSYYWRRNKDTNFNITSEADPYIQYNIQYFQLKSIVQRPYTKVYDITFYTKPYTLLGIYNLTINHNITYVYEVIGESDTMPGQINETVINNTPENITLSILDRGSFTLKGRSLLDYIAIIILIFLTLMGFYLIIVLSIYYTKKVFKK